MNKKLKMKSRNIPFNKIVQVRERRSSGALF